MLTDFRYRLALTEQQAEREVRMRRRLSRQREGSANRAKTRAAPARLTVRVRDRRADFSAQTARVLCAKKAVVALERLSTANTTRSVQGTVEKPGRRVR